MSAPGDSGRWMVWTAGLVVVVAAGAATAHGLYVVAVGSRTPPGIAWLYPVITDGLALVAYAATTRLAGPGRRYAWTVVVLAAGLSGLAQATYLAGSVEEAPKALRFGVGAWPAIAAAVAAHLLFLIGSSAGRTRDHLEPPWDTWCPAVPVGVPIDQAEVNAAAEVAVALNPRDRALDAADRHRLRHGELPSVRELEIAAQVSRGTAHRALRELRAESAGGNTSTDPYQGHPESH